LLEPERVPCAVLKRDPSDADSVPHKSVGIRELGGM